MLKTKRLMALALCCTLAACSSTGDRLDYKEAKNLKGLDVPPDLVAPENTGLTELPSSEGASGILPQITGVRVMTEAGERWLQLDEPAERLWPRLRSFWATLGLEVVAEQSQLGVMETNWAENRADTPRDLFARMVKTVYKNAYSAGTRDKYRLRLERGERGGSEVYISHYGLKQVVVTKGEAFGTDKMGWEVRPADPELVAEVLKRLTLYLGGSADVAAQALATTEGQPEKAYIEGDSLRINEGFARSWRLIGIALDRIGVVVEDRNRSAGIYYVGQIELLPTEDKRGWFGSLFSSRHEDKKEQPQLQVVIEGGESESRLVVREMDGSPRSDEVAAELLKRLQQELK